MRRTLGALAVTMAICAAAGAAMGWDTKSNKDGKAEKWDSIYIYENSGPRLGTTRAFTGNEHADIADLSLQQIGAAPILGKQARKRLNVVDLNASLFRPELQKIGTRTGDDAIVGLHLEQRELPEVPQWAGVPDFGYSVDDWINKNQYCPPRPAGDGESCHVYFGGWLAGFNSSHFGSQATLNYGAIHQTALLLAARAASLRNAVKQGWPGDLSAHRDKIEEAEFMALYYESAAQHFFQDRWAIGHMWQRWSAPDYDQNPYRDSTVESSEVGAASGLLHGSEALTGLPDAVSAPYFPGLSKLSAFSGIGHTAKDSIPIIKFGPDSPNGMPPLELATFRLGADGPTITGIGDEHAEDLFDGQFGREYPERAFTDQPIAVAQQRGLMMECLDASWADVIRSLGEGDAAGTYGVSQIPLYDKFRQNYRPHHTCTEMWMTNHSLYLGWVNDVVVPVASIARAFVNTYADGNLHPLTGFAFRQDWVAVTAAIELEDELDPDGINLARDGLPDMGLAKSGNNYGVATYLHPDLSTLPDHDDNGVDKESIFGFFNKANSDYFCHDLAKRLQDLRGSKDPAKQEICQYLAERAWTGTDPKYGGVQREERFGVDDKGQPSIEAGRAHAICEIYNGDARANGRAYDESYPEFLHPGYTRIRDRKESGPYRMAANNLSSESIANWCNKIPILNLVDDAEKRDADVVAEQSDPEDEVTVNGLQLGEAKGTLSFATLEGAPLDGIEITSWSETSISFKIPKDLDVTDDDILMTVHRTDKVDSVGRFAVRLARAHPKLTQVTVKRGDTVYYRDDGDEKKPTAFKPIDGGSLDIELHFDREMATEPIKGRKEEIKLGSLAVEGLWVDEKTWRGRVSIPEGDAYAGARGIQALSVEAASREGVWIDADPATSGLQPDVSRRVIVDELPVYAAALKVDGPKGVIYDGKWSEQPDLSEEKNLLANEFKVTRGNLDVSRAEDPPAEGQAHVTLTLSANVSAPPKLNVGGVAVTLSGKDKVWEGSFDLAAIPADQRDDYVPVVITGSDAFGRNLDADPRTPTTIALPDKGTGGPWWFHYESKPETESDGTGGDDHWHKLGKPPLASLVLILDGSGSMGDDNKMVNAKAGIIQALDTLPPLFEIGAVTFSGCGGVTSFPFSKSKAKVKTNLLSINPDGATPFAAALSRARIMLETEAHPLSHSWNYLPFSDGEETCGGDVGAEMARLNSSINRRQILNQPLGDEGDLKPPSEDPEENLPDVPCNPMTRTAYDMDVRDGGLHLDTITMIEITYVEQVGPGNQCSLTLTTRRFGVTYGANLTTGKTYWHINSQPSKVTKQSTSAASGKDAVEAFRSDAMAKLDGMRSMADARGDIERAVQQSLNKG